MTVSTSELLSFADEPYAPARNTEGEAWKVLVVDDDEDVHIMTELLLRETIFLGRPLHFLHAFSGKAARATFANTDDIAVAFIDVVMEHEQAGLELVRQVREELGNRDVSLILRTGQPGVAPERKIILDYDINDYKAKTELTADRLLTSLISALRHYHLCTQLRRARYNEVLAIMQLEAEGRDRRRMEARLTAERQGELMVLSDAMETFVQSALLDNIAEINRRILPLRLSLRSELHGADYDDFISGLCTVTQKLGDVAESLNDIIGAARPG